MKLTEADNEKFIADLKLAFANLFECTKQKVWKCPLRWNY